MANRLVIKYLEIDENNNVVNEWQHGILAAQETHHHNVHQHNNHSTPAPVVNITGGNTIVEETPVEVPTTLDLNIVLDLQDKDYTAYDYMARICTNANDGFDGNPWLAQDGGWKKSETHKLLVPIQENKKYFVRLATPPKNMTLFNGEQFTQNIVIQENNIACTEDWVFEHLANGLDVYTKCFDSVDSFPVITLKN
jgi:hypothetical protein